MVKNRRRGHYKFTEKTNSRKAFVALGMAAVSILAYVIFVLLSFNEAGQLSTYFGSAGILALLLSLGAIVLAIQSMLEEDSFKRFPRMAILFSAIAVLIWGATYGIGFVL